MSSVITAIIAGIIIELFMMVLNNITLTKSIDKRLNIIEKKQDKYNNVIERVYKLEAKLEYKDSL